MKNLILLALNFMRAGLLAIGGGLATLPFITEMAQTHPEWFTREDIATMVAVAESTPGPIGINMASFAGFKVAGIPGAIIVTICEVLPAFLIVYFLSAKIQEKRNTRTVSALLSALKSSAAGLIFAAGFSVLLIALFPGFMGTPPDFSGLFKGINIKAVIVFLVVAAAMLTKKGKKLHPLVYIFAGAVAGIVFSI